MTKKDPAPDLGALLTRAREVAPQLDAATKKLNGAIKSVESALVSLSLGVSASVQLHVDDGAAAAAGYFRSLTFGKHQQQWKLLFCSGWEDDENVEETPLLTASRGIRIECVDYMPKLVEALVAEAAEQAKNVETKASEADQVASTIRAALKSGLEDIPF
jgi:hypothetical protein